MVIVLKFYTQNSDKMAYTNSADPDQSPHCLQFHHVFCETKHTQKLNLGQKSME